MMFYLFSLNLFRNKNANLIFRISNVNLRSAYPQLSISLYVLFCRTFRISRRLLYSFMIALIYNIRIMEWKTFFSAKIFSHFKCDVELHIFSMICLYYAKCKILSESSLHYAKIKLFIIHLIWL